jgi:hypothetical protein
MALGSTQPLTEISTRNLPGGKGRPGRGADNLTVICEPTVEKMWDPRRLTTLWAFMTYYGGRCLFFATVQNENLKSAGRSTRSSPGIWLLSLSRPQHGTAITSNKE